ncbi:MAG TPA: hypothetical protein VEK39_08080 [Solirubrobacterales bacterium]|nr:hypothetical protein [Solirubrobacterales bacterium]
MAAETERDEGRRAWEDEPGHGGQASFAPEVSRRVSSILDAVEREAAELRKQAREEARRYVEYAKRRADGLVAERQRRISELSNDLISRADRILDRLEATEPVRAAFDDLVKALGETAERLAREAGDDYSDFAPPAFSEMPVEPETAEPGEPAAGRREAWRAEPPRPDIRGPETRGPETRRPEPKRPVIRHPGAWPPTPPAEPATSTPPPASHPGGEGGLGSQPWQSLNGAQVIAIQMAAAGSTRGEVEAQVRDSLGVPDPGEILDEVFGRGSPDDARVPWARPAPR